MTDQFRTAPTPSPDQLTGRIHCTAALHGLCGTPSVARKTFIRCNLRCAPPGTTGHPTPPREHIEPLADDLRTGRTGPSRRRRPGPAGRCSCRPGCRRTRHGRRPGRPALGDDRAVGAGVHGPGVRAGAVPAADRWSVDDRTWPVRAAAERCSDQLLGVDRRNGGVPVAVEDDDAADPAGDGITAGAHGARTLTGRPGRAGSRGRSAPGGGVQVG